MNQTNWSKAPEGATHKNYITGLWYKVDGYDVQVWDAEDEEWMPSECRGRDVSKVLVPRPTEPANSWFERGELPPFATVCEYHMKSGRWERCTITASGADEWGYCCVSLRTHSGIIATTTGVGVLRPVKTERERTIEAACKALGRSQSPDAGILYDAGLLRLPEGK